MRHIAAVPAAQTIGMLQDPSPAVIREATAALTARTRALPADLVPRLLSDPHRSEVRRAGYRLLRARGPVDQLRAALLLAADPDPRLARRAVADATRLARDATDPARRLRQPTIDPPPAHIAELIDLTNLAATALGPDTTRRLNAWLTSTTPRA